MGSSCPLCPARRSIPASALDSLPFTPPGDLTGLQPGGSCCPRRPPGCPSRPPGLCTPQHRLRSISASVAHGALNALSPVSAAPSPPAVCPLRVVAVASRRAVELVSSSRRSRLPHQPRSSAREACRACCFEMVCMPPSFLTWTTTLFVVSYPVSSSGSFRPLPARLSDPDLLGRCRGPSRCPLVTPRTCGAAGCVVQSAVRLPLLRMRAVSTPRARLQESVQASGLTT